MGVWKRSGELSAKSWGLVKANRELMRFPVMGAVWGAVVGGVPVIAGLGLVAASDGRLALLVAGVVVALAGAFLGTYAVTLRAAGLVAAADDLLHDRPATYASGMARARQHRGPLAGWALISATVGLLLSALQGGGGDGNLAVTILRTIAAGVAAVAWALISFFVLPTIVLEGLGPVGAIKRSASLIKARWGEAAAGGIRVSVRAALWWTVPGIALLAAGAVLGLVVSGAAGVAAGVVIGGVGFTMIVIGGVLASAARTVFAVALYRYAAGGEAPGPFTEQELATAVFPKGQRKAA